MPKSRTKQPLLEGFGGVLKQLHEAHEAKLGKKLSHDALARLITQRVGQRVSTAVTVGGTTLWRWEAGEVAGPDPIILRELCALYDVEFTAMLAVLETNLRNTSLTVDAAMHIVTQPVSGAKEDQDLKGRSNVPASAQARIRQLETQIRERDRRHAAAIRAMQDVTRRLANALAREGLAIRPEDAGTGSDES